MTDQNFDKNFDVVVVGSGGGGHVDRPGGAK